MSIKRVPLVVATQNAGNFPAMPLDGVDLQAWQEVGDEDAFFRHFGGSEYGLIRLEREPGMKSTAIAFRRATMRPIRVAWPIELTPANRQIGRGTGPDVIKRKFLVGGLFLHLESNRFVDFRTLHLPAGQRNGNRREDVGRDMVTEALHAYKRRCVRVLAGDFNRSPELATTRPLRRAGWTCDHLEDRPLPTHGDHWSPDHVWWDDDQRVEFVGHRTVETRSDHDTLVVQLGLSVRRDPRTGHPATQASKEAAA